ncbi:MAG: OmpH family outer membrane protein [Bacteroidia bacterium]|nr:OmpH family outer membrane protein [Bacteroidia bacterium]MCZ2247626.1 OmpH family outer membrane protein [Bacteroidia bacterium]
MKKLFVILSIAVMAFSEGAMAQKVAHININDLLLLMPERKKAETDIQEYAKSLDSQMRTMNAEYENKVQDYTAKESIMTEPVKLDKQKEISDLEDRIRNFQNSAQESLQKKQNELLEPMLNKAKKSIEEVAKENGYKMVIDNSQGILLYSEPGDDILNLVKKKMGLDATSSEPQKKK